MRIKQVVLLTVLIVFSVAGEAGAKDITVPGDWATLSEALEQIADGDRILLGSGEYEIEWAPAEPIGFSLIGEEGAEKTTVRGKSEHYALIEANGGGKTIHLSGISFDHQLSEKAYAVLLTSAQVEINDCRFLGGAGIKVDSCQGTIEGSLFRHCFDGLTLFNSPILVRENLFFDIGQRGIACRASEAQIYRNTFNRIFGTGITIVGKRRFPQVGGSPENRNVFLQISQYCISNDSRNEIDATHNYWGATRTSTMDQLGYPANIDGIFDHWDGENRVNGMVNYSNWLPSADPDGKSQDVELPFGVGVAGVAVGLLLIVLFLRMRRSNSS